MAVRNVGMQGQKFLPSSRFFEAPLTSLLFLGRAMRLSWAERTRMEPVNTLVHDSSTTDRGAAPELALFSFVTPVAIQIPYFSISINQ